MNVEVGPVIQAGDLGKAVVESIQLLNMNARVLVPGRCLLTRSAVEERTGAAFTFPGDLEKIMVSFKGDFSITENEAVWSASGKR